MLWSGYGSRMGYLKLDEEMVAGYVFYSAILLFKMLLMSPLTCYLRNTNKVVNNPEDTTWGGRVLKGGETDPEIERVRRAHLNDVENIYAFLIAGALYVVVQSGRQDLCCVLWHFRLFVVARMGHTVAYLLAIRQPWRGIFWATGWLITAAMTLQVIYTSATESILKA